MTLDSSRFPNQGTAKATTAKSNVNGHALLARQETQGKRKNLRLGVSAFFLGVFAIITAGCGALPKEVADAQSQSQGAGDRQGSTPVDVAIARRGKL